MSGHSADMHSKGLDAFGCVWHFSYGTRSVAGGSQYFVNARAHEMYDKLTMTFNKDGVLQTWRAWCQR